MKKKVIFAIVVVVVLSLFIGLNVLKSKGKGLTIGKGKITEVKTKEIVKGDIASFVNIQGNLEEREKESVYIETSVKVKEILVENGDFVKKGDPLFIFDIDSLQRELDQLIINKDIQVLSVEKIKSDSGLSSVQAQIQMAENNLKTAKESYNDALDTYNKNLSLFNKDAISKADLDRSKSAKNSAYDAYQNAQISFDSSMSGQDIDYQMQLKSLETYNMQIETLNKKLEQIEEASKASMDGTIYNINVSEGSYTSMQAPAYLITDMDNIQVKAFANEYNIEKLDVGQKVTITGDALNEEIEIIGEIKRLAPVAVSNGQDTVIEVIIKIDDTKGLQLRPGLNVDCDINISRLNNIIIADMGMLNEDKNEDIYVYRIKELTNTLEKIYIKVGSNSSLDVEVTEGLNEGDIVVLDPSPLLEENMKVTYEE